LGKILVFLLTNQTDVDFVTYPVWSVQQASEVTTLRGLFDVERCLPRDVTVYHSEMGAPGLALPDARLVDLAGLLSIVPAPADADGFERMCAADRPAAIFLPHKNYAEQQRAIRQSRCLTNYVRAVRRSSSPLHVRRDLWPSFRECATEVR
jgi:hypothetical protein